MFARSVSIHLKPNSSAAFTKQIENEILPMLRKQQGFQGEVTLLVPGGTDAVAISFWDTKENAEAYARTGYAEVLKNMTKEIEGTPKVQTYDVANSTFQKIAATVAARN
jgi:heme-degrading monooxygenase HmoA